VKKGEELQGLRQDRNILCATNIRKVTSLIKQVIEEKVQEINDVKMRKKM
jgi:hypothetical protein